MWYTVLNQELSLRDEFEGNYHKIKAGSIYAVRKHGSGILAKPIEGITAKSFGSIELTTEEARRVFTKPTTSFSDAIEESIMQSEANYC